MRILLSLTAIVGGSICFSADVVLPSPEPTDILSQSGTSALPRWCIVEGLPLLSEPRENAEPVGEELEFLEQVALAKGYPERDESFELDQEKRSEHKDWALVCIARGGSIQSFRGWVQRKYLISSLKAEFSPTNYVQKKAVVVNLAENVIKQKAAINEVRPLWTVPESGVSVERGGGNAPMIRLYTLLYIVGELDGWSLVSTKRETDELASLREQRTNILGWIPNTRLARWNSRECLQWNRQTFSTRLPYHGALFRSAEEAISAFPKITAKENSGGTLALFEDSPSTFLDDLGKEQIADLDNGAMRFHLLTSPADARHSYDNFEMWTQNENELFELGCVVTVDGKLIDMESRQRRLEQIAEQASTTEVLFVIDNTGSMDLALKGVSRVFTELITSLKEANPIGKIKVSAAFYHDGETAEEAVKLSGAPIEWNANTAKALEFRFTNVEIDKNAGSPLEQLFDGIALGIQNADFDQYSRKLLFVVGDSGDKLGNDDDPRNPRRRGLTIAAKDRIKEIASLLLPENETPIECHILHMRDPEPEKPNAKPAAKMFYGQMEVGLREEYTYQLTDRFAEENGPLQASSLFNYHMFPTPAVLQQETQAQLQADVSSFVKAHVGAGLIRAQQQGMVFREILKRYALNGDLDESAKETSQGSRVAVAGGTKAQLNMILDAEGIGEFMEKYGTSPYKRMFGWRLSSNPDALQVDDDGRTSPQRQLRRMVLVSKDEATLVKKALNIFREQHLLGKDVKFLDIARQIFEVQLAGVPDLTRLPDRKISVEQLNRMEAIERDKLAADTSLKALRFKSKVFSELRGANGKEVAASKLQPSGVKQLLLTRVLLSALLDGYDASPADYEYVGDVGKQDWRLKDGVDQQKRDRFFEEHGGVFVYVDFETEWP